MNRPIVDSIEPITLVGGGAGNLDDLAAARVLAPRVVAADGGAHLSLAAGVIPEAVIGDMDSLDPASTAQIPDDRLYNIPEQDSTDFDKALRSVRAPLILGVGFLGHRVDHQMAAMNRLCARPDRAVILLDQRDVVCHLPPRLHLPLAPKTRVSLFPMARVTGESCGLVWPIDGLDFAPDDRVGTSNLSAGPVSLRMEAPGMLLILPRAALTLLATALRDAALWPARAE